MRTPILAVLFFGAALCSGCSDDGKSNPVPQDAGGGDAAADGPHEGSASDGSPSDGTTEGATTDASDSGSSEAGDAGTE